MAVHPTAIIEDGAEIDSSVEIGPHVIVEAPCRIGPRTRIMANAVICRWTEIGADNVIHFGAVIGDEPQHLSYKGEEAWTRIGDRNIIREYVTIHRGFDTHSGAETRVGNDCFLMAASHVAHDCRVGDRVVMANTALLGGHCVVEEGAFLSNAGVHQYCRIGRLAILGASTIARSDVPPYMMAQGNSVIRGLNIVGLRRSGFSAPARAAIKSAYTTLYRKGLSVPAALEEIERSEITPEVRHLVDFIRASKRGICKHWHGESSEAEE